jgi:hypothetical protein
MDDLDYKKLIDEGREFLSLEMKYEKLTAVEKLSVLLSAIAFVAVVAIIGGFALFFLISTLVHLLELWIGLWAANLIVVLLLMMLIGVVAAFKQRLIVDPITRFITRLFLKANEDDD